MIFAKRSGTSTISTCSRTFAAEHGKLAPPALEDLRARVEAKQQKLRRRAESEFERLFAEKPRAFATRIAAYLGNPVIEPGGPAVANSIPVV